MKVRVASPGSPSAKGCAIAIALGLGLLVTPVANTDGLRDHLEPTTTRIFELVESDTYEAQVPAVRRASARRILDELFDWPEMARRALGPHWSARTPVEREDFVGLFADLLAGTYAVMLQSAGAAKIDYVSETVDGQHALVRTRLIVPNGEGDLSVDYYLALQDGQWKVYDIIFDDVGLIANYRAQFNRVLGGHSYAELLARIKEQLKAK